MGNGKFEGAANTVLILNEVALQCTDGKSRVPSSKFEDVKAVGVHGDSEEVGIFANAVAEIIRKAKNVAAVVELGQGNAVTEGDHEKLANGSYPLFFCGVEDGLLFG